MIPIGVFDSGVGGLSVLRALRESLPHDRFTYLADSAYAPYGERTNAEVLARCERLLHHLRTEHAIKALVVACNTATAIAIDTLREQHPELPVIGVEPALKPAMAQTRTGRIGVLATRRTLGSARFAALRARLELDAERPTHIIVQACDGLADAIERDDQAEIDRLCRHYVEALGPLGAGEGAIDTVVLGCTHYPFARERIQAACGAEVTLIETGEPVARQTHRRLQAHGLLQEAQSGVGRPAVQWLATGDGRALSLAARRWFDPDARVQTPKI